tara:strand:- start:12493 stop:12891 length:399 start_codon:yes stop_codon:yes gene_type:complete
MIYLKYLLMLILGWIGSIIITAIIGGILQADKFKIGGFIAGIISPSILIFVIGKIIADKNTNETYDYLPVILILLPYFLINIQAWNNGRLQSKNGNNILPVTGINMKINKNLVYGSLIGTIVAFLIFTNYSL